MLGTRITGIKTLDESILIAFSLLITCYLGPLKLNFISEVPTTLQSLLVVWFALAFGLRIGLASVFIYLIAGGLGCDVFAGGASGWSHLTGSNGGFLLAFPIGAFIAGSLLQALSRFPFFSKAKFITGALILFISQLAILVLGLFWQSALLGKTLSLPTINSIFIPGLLIKTALGTLVLVFISRAKSRLKS